MAEPKTFRSLFNNRLLASKQHRIAATRPIAALSMHLFLIYFARLIGTVINGLAVGHFWMSGQLSLSRLVSSEILHLPTSLVFRCEIPSISTNALNFFNCFKHDILLTLCIGNPLSTSILRRTMTFALSNGSASFWFYIFSSIALNVKNILSSW